MTFPELQTGLVLMSDYFPTFNPPEAAVKAWFNGLRYLPKEKFIMAVKVIIEKETQWFSNMNFVAIVRKHLPEAQERIYRLIEQQRIVNLDRQLEAPTPPEEAKANIRKIRAMLRGKDFAIKGGRNK